MTNQHDVSADKKGITHAMNLMNAIVVNAITALILSPVTYAADTGGPSATATCRKAYGGKVVGGETVGIAVAQVDLVIRGDQAKRAYAVGEVAAKPIEFDGMEIAAEKPMFRMEGFSWLERWYSGSKQPADGVLVELSFKDIPKGAKQIDSLEGTVEVLTGGDEKQVAIKDLSDRKNGPVESPVLKAAGLNISFNREVSQLDDDAYVGITMPVDERNTFAGLRLVDATGSLSNRSSQFSFDGSTFGCGYRIEKTDLAKTGLVILVRVGGELKTIPFRAENVIIE